MERPRYETRNHSSSPRRAFIGVEIELMSSRKRWYRVESNVQMVMAKVNWYKGVLAEGPNINFEVKRVPLYINLASRFAC